ncbi:hypothetical protein LTSEBAI_5075 [Salmonella enterica subsp. enterica serovar Baildon str. R6-199]|nr:hypothetical protein LTSEBAI_5075 [Salmonella enterica subsp. enterica serovar Baildon str. R6-199]
MCAFGNVLPGLTPNCGPKKYGTRLNAGLFYALHSSDRTSGVWRK